MERELVATLAEMARSKSEKTGQSNTTEGALAGVEVDNLTPELIRQLNLPLTTQGVMIRTVADDSNAADAGLRRGDVIEEINRQPVATVNDFRAAVQKAGKQKVLLRVRRAEGARYVVVRNGE